MYSSRKVHTARRGSSGDRAPGFGIFACRLDRLDGRGSESAIESAIESENGKESESESEIVNVTGIDWCLVQARQRVVISQTVPLLVETQLGRVVRS
jgi:hypothetical protein